MSANDCPCNQPADTLLFVRRVLQRTIGYGLRLHYELRVEAPSKLLGMSGPTTTRSESVSRCRAPSLRGHHPAASVIA
jgi:hypothetical protein